MPFYTHRDQARLSAATDGGLPPQRDGCSQSHNGKAGAAPLTPSGCAVSERAGRSPSPCRPKAASNTDSFCGATADATSPNETVSCSPSSTRISRRCTERRLTEGLIQRNLTPRQWELMRLMSAGMTNRRIATRLSISEGTVRTHCENIFRQLHVNNRVAAIAKAQPDDR
ncbi:MAG: response regulator transcription factor [Frankiaceae bacterium]